MNARFLSVGSILASVCLMIALACPATVRAKAIKVTLTHHGQTWQLMRDGKPYQIKGAGGDGDKKLLAKAGGNSFRTWGIGEDTKQKLDRAQANGLSVTLGIWLGHARHGFDYGDQAAVRRQFEKAKAAVKKFKDHPAVLAWDVGNEMEQYGATTDPRVWKAVNQIAAMIHKLDPNHPTMTTIAEIGGDKIPSIEKYCDAVDIVGINTYGGGPSIPQRYGNSKATKPYVATEFGPPGSWEIQPNAWGVPEEPNSTEKARDYVKSYNAFASDPMCLGSYAFAWGSKQEATATWYGLFLPDGTKTPAIDALAKAWSGKTGQPLENLSPRIESLKIVGKPVVDAGAKIHARLKAQDPDGQKTKVRWVLFKEMDDFNTAGDARPAPPTFPKAIVKSSAQAATIKMPRRPGNYRLFAFVHDGKGGGAVANQPLKVKDAASAKSGGNAGGKADPGGAGVQRGRMVNLPMVIYGDNAEATPYIASGYMGDTDGITLKPKSTDNPHSGKTALAVTLDTKTWGGVVWQSPANDWGDKPGGYDLSKAAALSFWARGAEGGETVSFGFGLIDKDKPFYDTAKAKRKVTLTDQWKQYRIAVGDRDLSSIKSGFYWTAGGQAQPVKFYLDDIVYTDQKGKGANGGKVAAAKKPNLPLTLVGDKVDNAPYVPSGYMGDTESITMKAGSTDEAHTGKTSTKVTFNKTSGWGGVVWQNPPNDWGDKAGGFNLSDAKTLSFWARGANGGEKVKFGLGILGNDATYADSASAEKELTLKDQWTHYTLELKGKDLSRIKSGFYWTLAGADQPITFYLDDVQYQK